MRALVRLLGSAPIVLAALALPSCGGSTRYDGMGAGAAAGSGNAGAGAAAGSGNGGSGALSGSGGSAGVGGVEMRACTSPTDCTLVNVQCCGGCGGPSINDLVPVNNRYASQVPPGECGGIACPPCPAPQPGADLGQYFAATCSAGQCTVLDIRQTAITKCSVDTDCFLRSGVGCCESCGGVTGWVAISNPSELNTLVCGSGPIGCPACFPTPDPLLSAACIGGECMTQYGSCTPQRPCPL